MSGYELDLRPVKAVVIGSQLAYGAVGNNTVARLIEDAGHRCVQVPTVLLSNLPHYPTLAGGPIPDQWLSGILEDLLAREVLGQAEYVFVGYLGHAAQAEIIAHWFSKARAAYPNLKMILDPAMGDDDVGMYADSTVAQGYREHLLGLAWISTPNRFELQLFTDTSIEDEQDAANACLDLMDAGCEHVLVTSAPTEDAQLIGCLLALDGDTFEQIDTARVESTAKGAGDCFTGLVLGQLLSGSALLPAVEFAVAGTATALGGKHPLFTA